MTHASTHVPCESDPVKLSSSALIVVAVVVQALTGPALALEVDLELVLAVDVSASIDAQEARQQRDGYIFALSQPEVIAAIQSGPRGRIAVSYLEWAGALYQRVVAGWAVVDDAASAKRFAETLARAPIGSAPGTSISAAIDFARREFSRNGHEGARAVIDISGDGPNSDGRAVEAARDDAVLSGLTINGLPLLSFRPNPGGGAPATGVYRHYARKVIGGPGAFVMPAVTFEDLAAALVEKLAREIRGDVPLS